MMQLTWIDFLLRLIPEGMLSLLCGYAVAKQKANLKLIIIGSVVSAVCVYIFKLLPVSSVIPSILTMISNIVILVFIFKIKVVHSVLSAILGIVLIIVSETLTIFLILRSMLGLDTTQIFNHATPIMRYVYGLPSLILYGIIIITFYLISTRKKEALNVEAGHNIG